MHALLRLAHRDLFAKKARFVVGTISIAIATGFALVLFVLLMSIHSIMASRIETHLAPNEVQVTPRLSVSLLGITKQEDRKLSEDVVENLSTISGVESVRKETVFRFPTSLVVSIFNTAFETDSPVYGIDDTLFESFRTESKGNADYEVLISQELVDIYNLGLAAAINKPRLNENILRGFTFSIRIGFSSIFRDLSNGVTNTRTAKIVGIGKGIPILGITMKNSDVETLNQRYLENYIPEYNKVFLILSTNAKFDSIKSTVETMGFDVFSFEEQVAPLKAQLQFMLLVFGVIVGTVFVIVMLSMFYLFYSQYQEKRYLIALLKTLGGGVKDIRNFFLIQVGEILVTGMLFGMIIGLGITWFLEQFLQSIQIISGTVLVWEWWYIPLLVVCISVVILLSVGIPLRLARGIEPMDVLSDY